MKITYGVIRAMHPQKLRLFNDQVHLQCEYALEASRAAFESLRHQDDMKMSFYHLQSLLNACANLSKLLWGDAYLDRKKKARARKERELLREKLGVYDGSILHNRDMRNSLEHFDEKIDWWWNESKSRIFIDFNIGPFYLYAHTAHEALVFRGYDPATERILFLELEVHLPTLVAEIERLFRNSSELQNSTD